MKVMSRIAILILCALCIGLAFYSMSLNKTNNKLLIQTKVAKDDLSIFKKEVELSTGNIEHLEKEKELRNYLDLQFDYVIQFLKNGDMNSLKDNVTKNIEVFSDRLICNINNNAVEFKLPEGDYHYRQRFYRLNDNNIFTTGYEIHQFQKPGEEAMKVCYVTFVLVDGQWKMDKIQVDIG